LQNTAEHFFSKQIQNPEQQFSNLKAKKTPRREGPHFLDGHRLPSLYRGEMITEAKRKGNPPRLFLADEDGSHLVKPSPFRETFLGSNIPGVWGQSPHGVRAKRGDFFKRTPEEGKRGLAHAAWRSPQGHQEGHCAGFWM
jgi:hypothetical protein